MNIVNLEEFKKLPEGALFMKYEPCCFEDLQAKGETLKHDFLSQNITYWPDCNGSDDFTRKLSESEAAGSDILMDFDCTGRDGCFDNDQLFAVYDKRDIEMLINKLNRCKVMAYE
tara:strand:+ start:18245 stop:18589 length:345 start_codon:yes stop_codon:yes gene_type:complete